MKVLSVRFLSFVAPPGRDSTVTEISAERDNINLHLGTASGSAVVFAETPSGDVCFFPLSMCSRVVVDEAPRRRGRPPKSG